MTNEGYIKDYRKKLSWEWFSDPFTAHFFEYCCLKAQYEDTTYRTIPITRGSFTASLNTMSVETGLSVQSIRTAIKHLTLTNDIVCQATNEFTLITVCKYNDYQADTNTANKQANTPANTPINTPANTLSKNIRREEENNIPPYNPPTGDETPEQTPNRFIHPTLDEVAAYCAERNNGIDPQHFINYYESCGWTVGRNKPMKDWKATIRYWERSNKLYQHNNGNNATSDSYPRKEKANNRSTTDLERAMKILTDKDLC